MGWFIFILVVVFLVVSAMPLIREIRNEKMRRDDTIDRPGEFAPRDEDDD